MSGKANADDRDDNASDDEERSEGTDSIADFLSQFNGGAHQFMVTRVEPRQVVVRGQAKRIAGHLATLLSPPTLDDLREQWGGGVYEIRVNSRTARGPRFVTCRRVEIAGDPKLPIDDTPPEPPSAAAAPTPPAESPALLQQILEHTFDDKRRVEERFDRERERVLAERQAATPDPAILQTTLGAIERTQREQLETLRQQLARRDQEMSELRQHLEAARGKASPLENPEVLRVLFGRSQDEANRATDQVRQELQLERDRNDRDIQAERERHQRQLEIERERHERELEVERRDREHSHREVSALREQHQRAIELEQERHQRESEAQRERYQRELETERERREAELVAERREHEQQIRLLERLHGSELENLRTSHVQLVATKDEHIGRLSEDIRTLRTAARPPDALSDLERVGKVVHAVRNFVPGLGGEAPEEASGWERLFDHARPLIERVADNLSKPPPVHVFPPVVAAAPTRGLVPARHQAARILRPQFQRSAPPRPSAPTPASDMSTSRAETLPAVESPPMAPTPTIAAGLSFLETAFKESRPVDEVARTASSLFPKGELRALMQAGPDLLVGEIERRSPDSLLASSGGRRYLRDLLAAVANHVEPAAS